MRKAMFAFVAVACLMVSIAAQAEGEGNLNYENAVMPAGSMKGFPLDTREKRSIRILSGDEAMPFKAREGETVISNFIHEGKFWIAKVPKNAVQEVYFQKDLFSKILPLAHSQIRYQLKPGSEIRLYPQDGTEKPKVAKISDLVFSVEATQVKGDAFNVVRGVMNQYAVSFRVMSQQESYYAAVFAADQHVEQIKLRISGADKSDMLANSLKASHEAAMNTMYNTACRSCTTELFRVIDGTVKHPWYLAPAYMLDILPVAPRTYLYLRGLIPFNEWIKNPTASVEEEFKHWHDDPKYATRLEFDRAKWPKDAAEFVEMLKSHGIKPSFCGYYRLVGK